MAVPASIAKQCADVGLPECVASRLAAMGYDSTDTFHSSFVDAAAFEAWLCRSRVRLGDTASAVEEADWTTHPLAGKLRRLWRLCQPEPVRPTLPVMPQPSPVCNALALLGDVGAPGPSQRLDVAERERLVKSFEKRFPNVALSPSTLPSLSLLQSVHTQCKTKSWSWIPWRRILSEEAALDVQSRRATRKQDMAEIVAEAAGLCSDEWDLDLSASPLRVQTILTVRAHAYAMAEGGHLHSWMAYVNKLMQYYTRRPGVGLRAPSPAEAEEADKEILCEVFRMVYHDGVSMDDALQSIVREDLFRVKLMPVLKVPPPPALDPSLKPPGGRRPTGGKEQAEPRKRYKKGNCFGFQEGKCLKSAKDCKFWHNCDLCGSADHGAAECKA